MAERIAHVPTGTRVTLSGKLRNYVDPKSGVKKNNPGYLYVEITSFEVIGVMPKAPEAPKNKKGKPAPPPPVEPEEEEETEGAL
jgi:hypothetical protein